MLTAKHILVYGRIFFSALVFAGILSIVGLPSLKLINSKHTVHHLLKPSSTVEKLKEEIEIGLEESILDFETLSASLAPGYLQLTYGEIHYSLPDGRYDKRPPPPWNS